jgi:Heat induced stress protein YflT domain
MATAGGAAGRSVRAIFGISALKEDQMETVDTVIAVFADHQAAETAVKKLAASGFEMKNLSVVGKGYHTDEKVVGFYNVGDRVKFWGKRGAFWGGLWGMFFGGLFLAVPFVGHVVVLGYLAAMAISAIETAVMVGGISALGAALYSIGIPKDSVIQYEAALEADSFLVMAHGTATEVARAKAILGTAAPSRLDVHVGVKAAEPADRLVPAAG